MTGFGISCIVVFVLGMVGAAVYDTWKWRVSKTKQCQHMYWIDGDEELFCIHCGVKRNDKR